MVNDRDSYKIAYRPGKIVEINICVFSFRRNVSKDVADTTSSGRPFQVLGHAAVANERSPTVARRDGRTSS